VTFRWKDYSHDGRRRTMTLTAMESLRRFAQHVLPRDVVCLPTNPVHVSPQADPFA
jgi:putative transposase